MLSADSSGPLVTSLSGLQNPVLITICQHVKQQLAWAQVVQTQDVQPTRGRKLFGIFLDLGIGLERCSFHFPRFSTVFCCFPCFALVSHFSRMFLTFSFFSIGLPCFSIELSCMFVSFSLFFIDFPCSPISHLSSFIFISCSHWSLLFLEPNLSVAVAASMLLLLFLLPLLLLLLTCGMMAFKKEREGGWVGGHS